MFEVVSPEEQYFSPNFSESNAASKVQKRRFKVRYVKASSFSLNI